MMRHLKFLTAAWWIDWGMAYFNQGIPEEIEYLCKYAAYLVRLEAWRRGIKL